MEPCPTLTLWNKRKIGYGNIWPEIHSDGGQIISINESSMIAELINRRTSTGNVSSILTHKVTTGGGDFTNHAEPYPYPPLACVQLSYKQTFHTVSSLPPETNIRKGQQPLITAFTMMFLPLLFNSHPNEIGVFHWLHLPLGVTGGIQQKVISWIFTMQFGPHYKTPLTRF